MIIEYRKDQETGYYEHIRYIKGRLLGEGGFGKVYECNLFRTNKVYAMKILDKYKLEPHDIKNLSNEIRIHRSLQHQNVCQFKHMFEDKRYCYMLLEVCDNRSMFEVVEERRMLSELETRYYMKQLIQGVQYLHENMVVHRDLKLDNIFLDRDLNVKIGDLGLSKRLGRSDELVTDFSGTLQYMAPEILDRSGHSFQADTWAIGVVMYTMLVGTCPFAQNIRCLTKTAKCIMTSVYEFPSHLEVSEDAKDLIACILQTDPSARPSLDQILEHPFFTGPGVKVLMSLPSHAAYEEPSWEIDEHGNLVAKEKEVEVSFLEHPESKATEPMYVIATLGRVVGVKDPNAVLEKHVRVQKCTTPAIVPRWQSPMNEISIGSTPQISWFSNMDLFEGSNSQQKFDVNTPSRKLVPRVLFSPTRKPPKRTRQAARPKKMQLPPAGLNFGTIR